MSSIAQIGPVPIPLISRLQRRLEEGLVELKELLSTLDPQSKAEQIHDIRVGTRRQRVLCRLLQVQEAPPVFHQLEDPLKKLTEALSSIRSWDVSTQQLKSVERQWRGEGKKDLGFLRKILKKKARRVRRKHLDKIPVDKFAQALDPQGLAPSWDLLSASAVERQILQRVEKSSGTLLKKWGNYQRTQSLPDLHQVRISLKKLRYFLEIQASCLAHPDAEKLGWLKSLQERLGYIHDLHVLQGHLDRKDIRDKIPSDKKDRYLQVQKYLKESLSEAVEDFQKVEGARLPAHLRGGLA